MSLLLDIENKKREKDKKNISEKVRSDVYDMIKDISDSHDVPFPDILEILVSNGYEMYKRESSKVNKSKSSDNKVVEKKDIPNQKKEEFNTFNSSRNEV